ncbi:MAG: mechanosensitive ion channel family protein [Bacteroidales bacterium]|jgi:small conductance mechanosensitive channel|nr:mechanosensitive ion channel [Bacteroidales bacterium]MDI9545395.1 mechanosensitive ion channel [Bacteroidota bacterium]MBP8982472.1 mechanosensitive ion channel [Bacteroidales bacterium]HOD26183.1 mechanosensitive ion channel [Bacteroidales bacterium]HPB36372.1 mechanosensitive ion channel [Bacteroidales bacterium]
MDSIAVDSTAKSSLPFEPAVVTETVTQTVESMNQFWHKARDFFTDVLLANVPRIIIALVLLWVGFRLVNYLTRMVRKIMQAREMDKSLQDFLGSLIGIMLKVLIIMSVMQMIGVAVTSFIAILGAAGLAIGMALQGTLQNFAGGVIILLLKPFKVGDFIEQGSISGTVTSIQIFNTVLSTPDNKVVIVPNSQLATNSLINYTKSEVRRVDVSVGIRYDESINKVRKLLLDLASAYPEVLKEPAVPVVHVTSMGESSVNLQLRLWAKTEDYWPLYFSLNQAVLDEFSKQDIKTPFNQLSVRFEEGVSPTK